MKAEQYIPQLIEIAEQDQAIDTLWVYGSIAKGTSSEFSDIDLAVLYSAYIKEPLARRLRPEEQAIEWCRQLGLAENKLSIVDMENAPIPLAIEILQTGKLLLNKEPGHELKVAQKVMSRWELDFKGHYRRYE